MPTNVDDKTLRGLMAQVARTQNKSIGDVSRFDLRALLVAGNFNPLTGNETGRILGELKSGPYPTLAPVRMVQFSFEFWYNYFYKELPDARRLGFAVHVINDDGSWRTEDQVANKTDLFQQMLVLGFRQFQARDHFSATELLAHAARDADNTLQRQNVRILFRGDGRDWMTIRLHQGTKPQTRIANLRIERNITKDWHPFKLQGNVVWVRNGEANKDNCLFSAVSVTPQFGIATKFPLLGDLIGTNPDAVGHAVITVKSRTAAPAAGPQGVAALRARFEAPAQAGPIAKTLAASQTHVYITRMMGGFNTQAYQANAAFPEYASDDIGWADHLVWLSVTRIHFSTVDGNAGHLIVINDHKWLQDDALIQAALLGPGSLAALKSFVADIVRRGSRQSGGIVYTPPGVAPPDYEIVTIRESFIRGRGEVVNLPAAAPVIAPVVRNPVVIPAVFTR